jgi:bloom syndrome protein
MPLISLIEDNLNFVQDLGLPACTLSGTDVHKNYSGIRNMEFKIVYLTPEKLVASQAMKGIMNDLYQQGSIDRFVIDEVHCVSNWG